MDKLLTINYYLNTHPNPDFQYTKLTLLLIGLLLVLGIALKIYRIKFTKDAIVKKMIKSYPGKFFTFATILLLLLFVREAGIPFISMRLWWIILFIYIIYWTVKVSICFGKDYKKRTKQAHFFKNRKKYLPRKKK